MPDVGGEKSGRGQVWGVDQEFSFGSANLSFLLDVEVEMASGQLTRGGKADKNTQCLWGSSNVPNTDCALTHI